MEFQSYELMANRGIVHKSRVNLPLVAYLGVML